MYHSPLCLQDQAQCPSLCGGMSTSYFIMSVSSSRTYGIFWLPAPSNDLSGFWDALKIGLSHIYPPNFYICTHSGYNSSLSTSHLPCCTPWFWFLCSVLSGISTSWPAAYPKLPVFQGQTQRLTYFEAAWLLYVTLRTHFLDSCSLTWFVCEHPACRDGIWEFSSPLLSTMKAIYTKYIYKYLYV